MLFEGEIDYKILVLNVLFCNFGLYISVGWMIVYFFLYGGLLFYGFFLVVFEFWICESISEVVIMEDILDCDF